MNFLDPETLKALTGLVLAVGSVIGTVATLVWNIRRRP